MPTRPASNVSDRVFRRLLLRPGFLSHFPPCGYDDPEILPTRKPHAVSKALTSNRKLRAGQRSSLVQRTLESALYFALIISTLTITVASEPFPWTPLIV